MNKTEIVFRNPELLQERVRDLVTECCNTKSGHRWPLATRPKASRFVRAGRLSHGWGRFGG